ncbi:MAG TPA: hypothetical protein VGA67_02020 [Candidatus Dojkabacteria bacterium]|jgi:transcription elongation factor Elf1
MDDKITTQNKQYRCLECKNENSISEDKNLADVVECDFCGIEYEIKEKTDSGEYMLMIMEDEK